MAKPGRPLVRSPRAKRQDTWLEPEELEILDRYKSFRGIKTRSDAIRAMVQAMGKWLEIQMKDPGPESVPQPLSERSIVGQRPNVPPSRARGLSAEPSAITGWGVSEGGDVHE